MTNSFFIRLISDVDIYHMDILVGYPCSVVSVVVVSRRIRSSLDMFLAVLARRSRSYYSYSRGQIKCIIYIIPYVRNRLTYKKTK